MNIKLVMQYDGTRYRGWQKQGNTENTIQGRLEQLLEKMTGEPAEVFGAGRTDAGVHARGQVANFKAATNRTPEEIKAYINQYLPEDISVISAEAVEERFHSRLLAKRKTYLYRLGVGCGKNVFERNYIWHTEAEPDVARMQEAARLLIGTHDFSAFTTTKSKKSTVRTLFSIQIVRVEDEIRFSFCGNGFLYHMVRILVGTLIEVGTGKRTLESVGELLHEEKRQLAGFTAPAKGLCLMGIEYL